MVTVRLKGVHRIRVRGPRGVSEYHYAWRGGPRLMGEPGSPDYIAAFNAALASRKAGPKDTVAGIIAAYKAAPKFTKLSEHTKRAYNRHLDDIAGRWGTMPKVALDDPEVRREFIAWRDELAKTPRTADMAIGTLKALLAWAVEYVHISTNQAEPISRLHSVNKSDAIWTAEDLTVFASRASRELRWAVELAAATGLRQGDLIRLAWNHEADGAFNLPTHKRAQPVTIPITRACRALLGRIDRRGPIILTTERGKRPWTADGLRSSFAKACASTDPKTGAKTIYVGRTFHDLRRTAATGLIRAGLDNSQVASIMGWSEADVEAMKRKYVSRAAVVAAVLAKLEKGG